MSFPESDFFFELYTEDIPSSYQVKALQHIRKNLPCLLKNSQLPYQRCEVDGTHRRIFILILSLSEKQDSWEEKKKGPPKKFCINSQGEHTPQLLGFAKKVGIEPKDVSFETTNGEDEEYSFVVQTLGGVDSLRILSEKIPNLFLGIPFEKTMRWGSKKISYARPIVQYLCHYKGQHQTLNSDSLFWKEIPQSKEAILDHITREKTVIFDPEDYFEALKTKGVILRAEERIQYLEKALIDEAQKENMVPVLRASLLREVNFLVERPKVLVGEFSNDFLKLPEIIITTEMQEHQKYFPLKDQKGAITNKFLIVANVHSDKIETADFKNISLGNQNVLASRLNDGAFFFEEDRKKSLSDYIEALKRATHQEKIGSMFDKKERIKKLCLLLLEKSSISLHKDIDYKRASDLLKADLTTKLVYEFNSLQGEIGSIYAELDGEYADVCLAIKEHYLPRFQGDVYPESSLGILCSLADKFDNLICSFLLGQEPSASHDPLGVRRQTIYIIEIIIRHEIELPILSFLQEVLQNYQEILDKQKLSSDELCEKIWNFFRARFSSIFEKVGFDKKMIQASLFTQDENICHLHAKMSALNSLKGSESFSHLMSAFTRMNNILGDNKRKHSAQVDEASFLQNEERSLYKFAQTMKKMLSSSHTLKNYEEIFYTLANSKSIVDAFFDHVMVMHKDTKIRKNRLALLSLTVEPLQELFNFDLLK